MEEVTYESRETLEISPEGDTKVLTVVKIQKKKVIKRLTKRVNYHNRAVTVIQQLQLKMVMCKRKMLSCIGIHRHLSQVWHLKSLLINQNPMMQLIPFMMKMLLHPRIKKW